MQIASRTEQPPTNLSVAQSARLRPIGEIAEGLGLGEYDFDSYGKFKGKLTSEALDRLLAAPPKGKLILVTAINPTPAGEGKTTTSVGLAQGLNRIGETAMPALREPALGPVFGIKGGATGGGYSQVLPMEDINLFFNGDFPAITAAHNLLSAMIDAHLHNGNAEKIDLRSIWWPRTVDMIDRALREIVVGLGKGNGYPRSDGFVITPASEVMAAMCLSDSISDLQKRLARIVIGLRADKTPVTASDIGAVGAMTALLRDARRPNLVQTVEGGPAFVHGGPFGNIAHGSSTVVGTKAALRLTDYVVTEGGFGSELGAEKFLNIVVPRVGVAPSAIVLVATIRALRHHGNGCLGAGLENLGQHIKHLQQYGPPLVVAVNRFGDDSQEDWDRVVSYSENLGVAAIVANPFMGGGAGCEDLARAVASEAAKPSSFQPLYESDDPAEVKIEKIVNKAYGGAGVEFSKSAQKTLDWARASGLGDLPICIAKTQYSLSDDPKLLGAPKDFKLNVREVKVSAGPGFLVAISGDIMLMPGMGKTPAALKIDVDSDGVIHGLY